MNIYTYGEATADLEKELRAMSGRDTLADALKFLRLVEPNKSEAVEIVSEKWKRGGAETYILCFTVKFASTERPFLLKACTPSASSKSLEKTFEEWIDKREQIAATGVSVPQLLGIGKAVLLEAFIPRRAVDLFQTEACPDLYRQLGLLAGRLERLGYRPTRILDDLRSTGDDLVMIDFGSDLGGALSGREQLSEETLRDKLVKELTGLGIPEDWIDLKKTEDGIHTALAEPSSTFRTYARH